MRIHRTQDALQGASRAELDATHLAFTGRALDPKMLDAVARVRCVMALLSAENAAGHLGILKGQRPTLMTLKERETAMKDQNFPDGTVAQELADAAPDAPAEKAPRKPRVTINRVRALDTGTSKMQQSSTRYAIFTHVQAAGQDGITVEQLDAATGVSSRSFLQKLLEKGHIEVIE